MQASELMNWNRPVPRYTSYPTVPNWGTIDRSTAAKALKNMVGPAEVYVHVPFCREQCAYCGCNMIVARREAAGDRFLEEMDAHINRLGLDRGRVQIQRLHLGGGTPTWLNQAQLERLMELIRSQFEWTLDGEISIEVDPATVDIGRIEHLQGLGFNRLSFGVQSLDPVVLEAVRRPQTPEQIGDCVRASVDMGMSVGVDMMCGLPNQDIGSVIQSLRSVCGWGVHRVAVFNYAHVPWVKPNQRVLDSGAMPDTLNRIQSAIAARTYLRGQGFELVGIDHYARFGDPLFGAERIHRNFMGYTTNAASNLIGLGPSAISEVSGVFWQAPTALPEWWAARGPLRGHILSEDDKLRAALIERIMCEMQIQRSPGFDQAFSSEIEAIMPLSEAGGVWIDDDIVQIIEPMMARLVARQFDAYKKQGGFSNAM